MKAILIAIIVIIVAISIIMVMQPRFWRHVGYLAAVSYGSLNPYQAYKIAAGSSYGSQRESGIPHILAFPRAKHSGLVYSIRIVTGIHLPLLCLTLVTIQFIKKIYSSGKQIYLTTIFILLCLWGILFLGLAHRMILRLNNSPNDPFPLFFAGSFGIWVIIAAIFGFLITLVISIRYLINIFRS